MKSEEFVKGYQKAKKTNSHEAFIKKHITKTYLPFELKIAEAKDVVEKSCYKEINGKRVFQQNSPAFFMLFMLKVIANYTDIEIGENEEALTTFNAFAEAGLFEALISIFPREYDSFNTVLQMVKDDEMENYRSLAGFFETKVESLDMALTAIAETTKTIDFKQK